MTAEPYPNLEKYCDAGEEAIKEVWRARYELGFGLFHSAHEGYAVILEEMDELWEHVKTNSKHRNWEEMRKEAMQVAAMAIAFMVEVTRETP